MKINSSVRYTIKQFINYFLSSYGIFSTYTLDQYIKDNLDDREITNFYLPFTIAYGTSKLCLLFEDFETPYAIKIPLYHSMNRDAQREYIARIISSYKNGVYPDFDNEENLCQREADIYADANEYGVGIYFAAEERIMTYRGIPVYVQERLMETFYDSERYCDPVSDDLNAEIEEVVLEIGDYKELDDFLENKRFVADLYVQAGKDFKDILYYIVEQGIDDLHNENVGYDYYGHAKLMDYSGFRCA